MKGTVLLGSSDMRNMFAHIAFLLFSELFEERPRCPIQGPNKGRKEKAKGSEKSEIRSSLLILDLYDGKL